MEHEKWNREVSNDNRFLDLYSALYFLKGGEGEKQIGVTSCEKVQLCQKDLLLGRETVHRVWENRDGSTPKNG